MTVSQSLIPLSARSDWDEALEGITHAFAHSWEYCSAMQRSSGFPTFLYSYRRGTDQFVCPLAERSWQGAIDLVTPFGFAGFVGHGSVADLIKYWTQFACERNYVCAYVGLHPSLVDPAFLNLPQCFSDNDIFALDLTCPEALKAELSQNRRRQIALFEREGLPLVTGSSALEGFFVKNLNSFLASKGATEQYHFSDASLRALLAAEEVLVLGSGRNGEVQAATMLAHSGETGEYLFGVSEPASHDLLAPLLWHGALLLRERGVRLFNLGGGIRRDDSVAEFKRRFGAKPYPLPALKIIFDPHRYETLCSTAGVDFGDLSGYFPAYRRLLRRGGEDGHVH